MKEQPLDIASLMQIEDLKNANNVLDSMVNDLRVEVQQLREQLNRSQQVLANMITQQVSALGELRGKQADAPPAAPPWQQADGWEGRQ